ncbi:MAG: aminotransferase class V-fold PLP-dependent enzyme, partial [Exilispira sp.]
RKYNENIFIHVDAVQGFLKLPLFILDNIDSVSFSAHKFGGLKGVSSLYIRDIKKIRPIIFGGGQMNNLFPSTENVSAIYSMVQTSIFLFAEISSRIIKNKEKKEYLIKLLSLDEKLYKNLYLFSNNINFSPYIIKIYNNKIPAQILQNILSDENIMVSIGSACSSNRKKELFDFRLYGLPSNLSDKGIRVSLFIGETKEEIEIFISKLSQIISKYSFL